MYDKYENSRTVERCLNHITTVLCLLNKWCFRFCFCFVLNGQKLQQNGHKSPHSNFWWRCKMCLCLYAFPHDRHWCFFSPPSIRTTLPAATQAEYQRQGKRFEHSSVKNKRTKYCSMTTVKFGLFKRPSLLYVKTVCHCNSWYSSHEGTPWRHKTYTIRQTYKLLSPGDA